MQIKTVATAFVAVIAAALLCCKVTAFNAEPVTCHHRSAVSLYAFVSRNTQFDYRDEQNDDAPPDYSRQTATPELSSLARLTASQVIISNNSKETQALRKSALDNPLSYMNLPRHSSISPDTRLWWMDTELQVGRLAMIMAMVFFSVEIVTGMSVLDQIALFSSSSSASPSAVLGH
jgi:hypothetical protein